MFAMVFMSKKQHTPQVEIPKSLSIGLTFLKEGKTEHLQDLKKHFSSVHFSNAIGAQGIQELAQEKYDIYVIAETAYHVKTQQFVAVLASVAKSNHKDWYYTAVPGQNKSRLTELFSGMGKAEWHTTFVAFGADAFEKFHSQNITPADAYELVYLAEKTCCHQEIAEGDKKEIQAPSAGAAIQKKLKTSIKYYTGGGIAAIHKYLFLALSTAALIACMLMSKNAGISGDEFTQYEYSKLTANYYEAKLGKSISIDTMGLKGQKMTTLVQKSYSIKEDLATQEDPERLMHLYGASFDTFTTLLIRWFEIQEVMDFRHLINSIFGFLCIFFGALIVRRVTGGSWKYAWITLVLLFFTPRLLGESFNNPKDIPFAAGFVIATYYMLKAFGNLRVIRLSSLIGLALGVALGISIRIGGLLSIAIFVMYAGLEYIQMIGLKEFFGFRWKGFTKILIPVVGVGLASYLLGVFLWPYGWEAPFDNPIKALKSFSNYAGSIRQLFEGKLFDSDMLPSYYLIKYVFITTPIAAVLGMVLNLVIPAWRKSRFSLPIFMVFFSALFPILYIFVMKSQVYGGLRHILFTIPLFVASGVIGYWLIEKWLSAQRWAGVVVPAAALGLTVLPAKFVADNHPLEYIYFNEFVGGTAGAYGLYEMDYYLAGLRPSTEWFLENVARKNPTKRYQILTYGPDQVKYYCRKDTNVRVGFTRYDDRSEKKWDYAIFYNAYLDKERLLGGKYPPVGTVFTPMVDGKPMGLVMKRLSYDDFEANQALNAKNYRLAIEKFNNYLKVDKNSNEVYFYLSTAYANLNNLDSAIWAAKQSVALYPEFSKSLFALNQYYVNKGDYENALKVMDQYLLSRPKDADAYLIKAQTFMQKGDLTMGLSNVQEAIKISPMDSRCYMLGAQIYQAQKDQMNLSLFSQAVGFFQAKDQTQYSQGAEAIKGIYMSLTGEELVNENLPE